MTKESNTSTTGTPVPRRWPNGCDSTVPEALRYLAQNPRPRGGQERFNAEHLYQLAGEIEAAAKMSGGRVVIPSVVQDSNPEGETGGAGVRFSVVKIPPHEWLDPITLYFEDYKPGAGRMTVACHGDAWTVAWGAMGDRTVQQFVATVGADYLAGGLLELRGGTQGHRKYTQRIAAAIVAHLATKSEHK